MFGLSLGTLALLIILGILALVLLASLLAGTFAGSAGGTKHLDILGK